MMGLKARVRGETVHPRFTTAMRWWITGLPVSRLLLVGCGTLLGYALLGAVVEIATSQNSQSIGARFTNGTADLHTILQVFRASLGDPLGIDQSNTAQQLLASVTSIVGVLVPAIVIGIVFIRLFSVKPFIWREKVSICLPSECEFDEYAAEHADSTDGLMAIRFYNRFNNLRIVEMVCQAFVHFVARSANHGGTIHKVTLEQLDASGKPALERRWPSAELGAPFTLWIPIGVPVEQLPVKEIQGRRIDDKRDVMLLVRVTAKTVGLGTDIVEEHWYRLDSAESVELGRYVPIDVDPALPAKYWAGWPEFDKVQGPVSVPPPQSGDAQDEGKPEGAVTAEP